MTRKNRLLQVMPQNMDALLVTNEKNQRPDGETCHIYRLEDSTE